MDAAAAFAGLAGAWRLAREIPDQGRMSGEAVFTQGDDRRALHYRETGTLELPDGRRIMDCHLVLGLAIPEGAIITVL